MYIHTMKELNISVIIQAVKAYDSISRLDTWYTTMLLRLLFAHSLTNQEAGQEDRLCW